MVLHLEVGWFAICCSRHVPCKLVYNLAASNDPSGANSSSRRSGQRSCVTLTYSKDFMQIKARSKNYQQVWQNGTRVFGETFSLAYYSHAVFTGFYDAVRVLEQIQHAPVILTSCSSFNPGRISFSSTYNYIYIAVTDAPIEDKLPMDYVYFSSISKHETPPPLVIFNWDCTLPSATPSHCPVRHYDLDMEHSSPGHNFSWRCTLPTATSSDIDTQILSS